MYDAKLAAKTPEKRKPGSQGKKSVLDRIRATIDASSCINPSSRASATTEKSEVRLPQSQSSYDAFRPSKKPQLQHGKPSLFVCEEGKEPVIIAVPAVSHYVNDHAKMCKFVDPNPLTVVVSTLKDLLFLLKKVKGKSADMFHAVHKLPEFELVKREMAAFRVCYASSPHCIGIPIPVEG